MINKINMNINEQNKICSNHYFINGEVKLKQTNNNKIMSSPQVKKLFYNKSNFKTDEDFSNECSHSNKKTMTTFYGNNESINYNKTFFSKKNLKL